MGHAMLYGVYDRQGGPRGGEKVFVSGMAMGMARRPVGPGIFQLRAGLSPDPLMGRRGFPLLLASGETADGANPLVDRQHPHDLFVELSASYSLPLSESSSLFAYAGLPGEPAFGPPPFMHRLSALDSPEAPITHHWLDSTHISFGVITAGIIAGDFKLEGSRFNGREPDQHRFDIETGPLDSTALRLSWNPARSLSLQASWARLIDSEQLEPGEDQTRWSATRALQPAAWQAGPMFDDPGLGPPLAGAWASSMPSCSRARCPEDGGPCSGAPSARRMTSLAPPAAITDPPTGSESFRWGHCTISGRPRTFGSASAACGPSTSSPRASSRLMGATGTGRCSSSASG